MNIRRISQPASLQSKLTRLVVGAILAIFLIGGLVAFATIRSGVRDDIRLEHQSTLTALRNRLDDELRDVIEDVRRISVDPTTRAFAGETVAVASTTLAQAQQRLVTNFIALAEQHPSDYLEIRYVTRTGTIWTQVTGYEGIVADTSEHINALSGDEALTASLRQMASSVVIGPLRFRRDADGQIIQPPQALLRFSAPVAAPDDASNLPGAIQIDVAAGPLMGLINEMAAGGAMAPGRRFLLVNSLGQILADSGQPERSYSIRGIPGEASSFSIQFPALDQATRNQSGEFVAVEAGNFIFSGVNIEIANSPTMPWRLLMIDDAQVALRRADTNAAIALALCVVLGAAVSLTLRTLLLRILRPLTQATSMAQRLTSGGDTDDLVVSAGPSSDEIGQLVEALQHLAAQVQRLKQDLETQVGRYTRNLQIAARIGRETATLYDIGALLNRAIDLIVTEFGFYHAQVFLLDDVSQNAVLFYSHGEAGRALLERGHRLAVGSVSVIGQVTSSGEVVLVNDTEAEGSPHRPNPLLPETRAELALPLQVAGTIIGALDIQSKTPNVFQAEELQTFQLLADQIAIAIHNARLLQESEARVEQINALNRRLTRSAWQDAESLETFDTTYTYDLFKLEQGETDESELPPALSAEIAIRGEVIGQIDAAAVDGIEYTDADQALLKAVAERVALALENARLFEETQSSLAQTSLLYRINRFLNEADTLADIVQALIDAVMPDAMRGQVGVFGTSPDESAWMTLNVDWMVGDHGANRTSLTGTQIYLPDHPLLREMQPDGVTLLSDIQQDDRLDPVLRGLFDEMGARAAVLIPFSVRGVWRGLILIEFPEPREFSEREERTYSTLIDQVGVAIDNRLLLRQTEMALSQVERLYSASRIINTAQTSEDLTRAAVRATRDDSLHFALGLFEGPPDESGWPTTVRIVARAQGGEVRPDDQLYLMEIERDSPLRANEPHIIPDVDIDESDTTLAALLRLEEYRFGAMFPLISGNEPIAIFLITSHEPHVLSSEDYDIYRALTGQMSTVLENRRLFQTAEAERQTLRSTLETLPAGVLVLDAATLRPTQYNEQAVALLGRAIDTDKAFSPTDYPFYRTGTDELYPREALPIFAAHGGGGRVDDVAVMREDGTRIDLLVNAAPIVDARGHTRAIVAAFTDISTLRRLEATLQDNLRDTITLYEATRALADAVDEDAILDLVIQQLATLNPTEGYIVLVDEELGTRLARSIDGVTRFFPLPEGVLDPQRPLMIHDMHGRSSLSARVRGQLLALGVESLVSLPLRARSRRGLPIGWMVITFDTNRVLTAEEERFLTTINDAAAVALDNRFLLRNTEIALQETAALYTATTSISRARDLEELSQALQSALETLSPDMYAAYLLPSGDERHHVIEMFNVNLDGAPFDAAGLIERHREVVTDNLYFDDLRLPLYSGPLVSDLRALGTIRAAAIIDLRIKGTGKGRLLLAFHQPRHFGDSEMRYLGTIADSASVVIDNILLLNQIQNALDETSTLYRASRALSDAATPADILNVVAEHLVDSATTLAFLATLSGEDWKSPSARIAIAAGWHRDGDADFLTGSTLNANQFAIWRQLSSPDILLVENVAEDERLTELERMTVESLGLGSFAVLPLRAGRRALGAILLGSQKPRTYDDRDLRVFQSFAEQASLKLDAARLLEQTERRARQLATSAEVSRSASTLLDLDALLPRLVDLIRDSFGYDHAQIFLMDENDEYAVLRASTGDAGRILLSINHRLMKGSSSVVGRVVASGQPIIALDTTDASVIHRPNPYLPNTRSEMAVPLIVKNRVVGALDVQSNMPNAFDEEDVAVVTTLAAQISVAIDNARLYAEARQRANEMSFLFDVTTAAAASDTLQHALQNVADRLRDSMNALSVSIYLPEPALEGKGRPDVLQAVALAGSEQPLSELSQIDISVDSDDMLANAARTRRPVIIGNIAREGHYFPVVVTAQSAVIVPLASGAQLVGLVTLESATLNAFSDDTLTLLLTLSGSLSAIVQNQQLLEQVQRSNEELRTLDKLKSDFLANMSHELRTPLNSIIGFSRVILKGIDGPLTEMQEQDLTTIYNSGQHLLNLINDILDQAKINANKMDLQTDYFEVKPVIDGVRSIGIGLVKDKPIDIYVNMASGLPKAYGDEFRTRQILLNLVSNAAKFTHEGSITLSVYTEPDPETGKLMIRIDVTDTGIGIAEKDIPLLFEAFRQIDSSLTRTVGGTGLGLPIARSLVEMQGGRMMVTSQVNVGSTFSITLPTEAPTGEPAPEPMEHAEPTSNGHDAHPALEADSSLMVQDDEMPARAPITMKRQILIIDDNPEMVDQFRRTLQREGFDIFAASIPLEAEAMASGLHPTLILLDVNFAEGSGWDILRRLKSRDDTLDIPVVVVTLSDEAERATEMGAFRFIQRPFMPEQLIEAVREAEKESRIDRILIIDDQPESVRLLEQLLEAHGQYRVFSAENGQDGIALVARRRPNLILLDLRMPGMDGFAVIEELRANPETVRIPILVVTGDVISDEERERLNNLDVVYKTDISLDTFVSFVDGVRAHLARSNGA